MSQNQLFAQSQSQNKFYSLHFSIFLLEIFNTAFQLNLIAYYRERLLNFNFGTIFQKSAKFNREAMY